MPKPIYAKRICTAQTAEARLDVVIIFESCETDSFISTHRASWKKLPEVHFVLVDEVESRRQTLGPFFDLVIVADLVSQIVRIVSKRTPGTATVIISNSSFGSKRNDRSRGQTLKMDLNHDSCREPSPSTHLLIYYSLPSGMVMLPVVFLRVRDP
jgi:hypothetical protein